MRNDLATRLDAMDGRKDALLGALGGLAPDRLSVRPPGGGWCALDVAQHLVLVEESVLGYARRKLLGAPQPVPLLDRARLALLVGVLRSPIRVRAPVPQVVPAATVPLEESAKRWGEVRAALRAFLAELPEERLRSLFFRHPIAGALDVAGTLRFLDEHARHHEAQLDRIWRSAGPGP